MTSAIWITAAVGYLTVAVMFARTRLRHWYRSGDLDTDDGVERGLTAVAALAFGSVWPAALAFLALRDWLLRPADRDVARRAQMRRDRDDWRQRARTASDAAERRTAADIADTLDDLLRAGGSQ